MAPWMEDAARQNAWDRRCSRSPVCSICGEPLIESDLYLELEGELYCERCIRDRMQSTECLEVQ